MKDIQEGAEALVAALLPLNRIGGPVMRHLTARAHQPKAARAEDGCFILRKLN
jgi:hypothetical protein